MIRVLGGYGDPATRFENRIVEALPLLPARAIRAATAARTGLRVNRDASHHVKQYVNQRDTNPARFMPKARPAREDS